MLPSAFSIDSILIRAGAGAFVACTRGAIFTVSPCQICRRKGSSETLNIRFISACPGLRVAALFCCSTTGSIVVLWTTSAVRRKWLFDDCGSNCQHLFKIKEYLESSYGHSHPETQYSVFGLMVLHSLSRSGLSIKNLSIEMSHSLASSVQV